MEKLVEVIGILRLNVILLKGLILRICAFVWEINIFDHFSNSLGYYALKYYDNNK